MKIRFRFLVLGLRPCQEFPRKKSRKEKGWMMDQHDVLKLSVAPKVTVRTLEKRGVGEIPTCRYRQICSDITPIYIYIILYVQMFKTSQFLTLKTRPTQGIKALASCPRHQGGSKKDEKSRED